LCGDRVSDDDVGVSFLLVCLLWTSKEDRPAPAGAEWNSQRRIRPACAQRTLTSLSRLEFDWRKCSDEP
jgi:hypothetical protein